MIYVSSDLHGYPLEKFRKLLEKANFSHDDFLFVLGDVIDRGPDGIKLLQWLMLQPNAELILGNHEATMLSCDFLLEEITEESIARLTGEKLNIYSTWMINGGMATTSALSKLSAEEKEYIFEYLREAPLYEELNVNGRDFLLVHSGLGCFDKDKNIADYARYDILWSRPSPNVRYYEDKMTIFGHTPTFTYGAEFRGKAIVTDTWINIDTGAGAGIAPMLLRLDDMQEFYVDGEM